MTQVSAELYPVTVQNVRYYRLAVFDKYPRLTHAIFTRQGGFSVGPYHSFNLSTATGDKATSVAKNFQVACQILGISPAQTAASQLVHKTEVIRVDPHNRQAMMGQADGLITNSPHVFLFMRFGDCTPLLLGDMTTGAVGLMHAGWRGTLQNAAGAAVKAMVETFACRPENIIAVIGPAIGPCCYEVGREVIEGAAKTWSTPERFFSQQRENHAHFDLWQANQHQLAAAGVGKIIQTKLCTACHPAEFFSHRAEKGQTGRFGVIIGLNGGSDE
jgi:YfiH family protein